MTNKKNYWLFSIVLLAAAESTYEAGCLKKCKECCCGKLCNKDDENKDNEELLSPDINFWQYSQPYKIINTNDNEDMDEDS